MVHRLPWWLVTTRYRDDYPTCARTFVEYRYANDHNDLGSVMSNGLSEVWTNRGATMHTTADCSDSRDLRRHLDLVLNDVESGGQGGGQLWCFWESAYGHGGPMLDPTHLARAAALDVELCLEVSFGDTPSRNPARPEVEVLTEHNGLATPLDPRYPSCERTAATLAIYPANLSKSDVTRLLGLEPTDGRDRGTTVKGGLRGVRVTPRTVWFLESESVTQSRDLRDHLNWLLHELGGAHAAMMELREADPSCELQIRVVWWTADGHGGPALWPRQMSELADLGLPITFDLSSYV